MALNLSNATARELLHKMRERVHPWGDFLDTRRFQLPTGLTPLPGRVLRNLHQFHGNYLFVFVGLFIFCLLTSPLLLVAVAICLGACYFISSRGADEALVIMGHQLTVSQQYLAVAAFSFPLFWLAGAGSAVFWIIGASFFFIMLHAVTYSAAKENDDYDLEMDSIETLK